MSVVLLDFLQRDDSSSRLFITVSDQHHHKMSLSQTFMTSAACNQKNNSRLFVFMDSLFSTILIVIRVLLVFPCFVVTFHKWWSLIFILLFALCLVSSNLNNRKESFLLYLQSKSNRCWQVALKANKKIYYFCSLRPWSSERSSKQSRKQSSDSWSQTLTDWH